MSPFFAFETSNYLTFFWPENHDDVPENKIEIGGTTIEWTWRRGGGIESARESSCEMGPCGRTCSIAEAPRAVRRAAPAETEETDDGTRAAIYRCLEIYFPYTAAKKKKKKRKTKKEPCIAERIFGGNLMPLLLKWAGVFTWILFSFLVLYYFSF